MPWEGAVATSRRAAASMSLFAWETRREAAARARSGDILTTLGRLVGAGVGTETLTVRNGTSGLTGKNPPLDWSARPRRQTLKGQTMHTPIARRSLLQVLTAMVVALVGLVGLGVSVGMGPEPDPIPRKWELTIEPGPLRYASVDDGTGPKGYFYLTYTVTNTTGKDMLFTPSFELCNDKGEVVRSGRDVPAAVTKAILDRLDNKLIQDQISIVGMLLQGEGNAKEGLVVFPATTLRFSQLEVYAMGFSGETKTVEQRDAKTGKMVKVTLRKTLMLRYQPTGEVRTPGATPFELIEKRWVMR